jgi:hypothetical protein
VREIPKKKAVFFAMWHCPGQRDADTMAATELTFEAQFLDAPTQNFKTIGSDDAQESKWKCLT